jgi:hypothetical protein
MKNVKNAVFAFVMMAGTYCSVNAQDSKTDNHTVNVTVPEVALLDLEQTSARNFTMTFVAPTEAGLKLSNPLTDTRMWLNYTSIVTASGPDMSRMVKVKTSVNPPPGITFSVEATPTAAVGKVGTTGTGAQVTLDINDSDLVTGIGSCYTGDGNAKGHQLTYRATAPASGPNFAQLIAGTTAMIVTYTLTDNP